MAGGNKRGLKLRGGKIYPSASIDRKKSPYAAVSACFALA